MIVKRAEEEMALIPSQVTHVYNVDFLHPPKSLRGTVRLHKVWPQCFD